MRNLALVLVMFCLLASMRHREAGAQDKPPGDETQAKQLVNLLASKDSQTRHDALEGLKKLAAAKNGTALACMLESCRTTSVPQVKAMLREVPQVSSCLRWQVHPAVVKAVPEVGELLDAGTRKSMCDAVEALRKLDIKHTRQTLFEILRTAKLGRRRALSILFKSVDSELVEFFIEGLKGGEWWLKWDSKHALIRIGKNAVKPLEKLLHETDDSRIRATVSEILMYIGKSGGEAHVRAFMKGEPEVKELALKALGYYAMAPLGLDLVKSFLDDKNARVRSVGVNLLADSDSFGERKEVSSEARDVLTSLLLKDEASLVRCAAARSLGAMKDKGAVPSLVKALKDSDVEVRKAAARALGSIRDKRAIKPLIAALQDTEAFQVGYCDVHYALSQFGKTVVPYIVEAYDNVKPRVRAGLIEILQYWRDRRVLPVLLKALEESNISGKTKAARAFEKFGWQEGIRPLVETLKDGDWRVRQAAAQALGSLRAGAAVVGLKKTLRDTKPEVRKAAATSLGRIGGKEAVEALAGAMKLLNAGIRAAAAEALGEIGSRDAVAVLVKSVDDKTAGVRCRVIGALGKSGDGKIVPLLTRALEDSDHYVQREAVDALERLGDARAFEPLVRAVGAEKYVSFTALAKAGGKKALDFLRGALRNPELRDRAEGWLCEDEAILAFGEDAVELLTEAAKLEKTEIRLKALELLAALQEEKAFKPLLEMMKHKEEDVRKRATKAIALYKDPRATAAVVRILTKWDSSALEPAAYTAVESLVRIGDRGAVRPLVKILLEEKDCRAAEAAAVALGRMGDKTAVEPLMLCLQDDNDSLRKNVVYALGLLRDRKAANALAEILKERDHDCAIEVVHALASMGDRRAGKHLMAWAGRTAYGWKGYEFLRESRSPESADCFLRVLTEDDYYRTRSIAAAALGDIGDRKAIEPLKAAMESDEEMEVRAAAANALLKFGCSEAKSTIEKALASEDIEVRTEAVKGLVDAPHADVLPWLVKAARDSSDSVRMWAVEGLGHASGTQGCDALIKALDDKVELVCRTAVKALACLEDERAIEPLINLLEKGRDFEYTMFPDIRYDAIDALEKITNQNFGWNHQKWRSWLKNRKQ